MAWNYEKLKQLKHLKQMHDEAARCCLPIATSIARQYKLLEAEMQREELECHKAMDVDAVAGSTKHAREFPTELQREISRSMLTAAQVDAIVNSPGFEDLTVQERNMRKEAVLATLFAVVNNHAYVYLGPPEEHFEIERADYAAARIYNAQVVMIRTTRVPFKITIQAEGRFANKAAV